MSRFPAARGAVVSILVFTTPTPWSITMDARVHAATFPMDLSPIPRTPNFSLGFIPIFLSGMKRSRAWTKTPSDHMPAVRAILP